MASESSTALLSGTINFRDLSIRMYALLPGAPKAHRVCDAFLRGLDQLEPNSYSVRIVNHPPQPTACCPVDAPKGVCCLDL
jgi:hypothetical protein